MLNYLIGGVLVVWIVSTLFFMFLVKTATRAAGTITITEGTDGKTTFLLTIFGDPMDIKKEESIRLRVIKK